jgi:S-adenosylmethionine:tRNA ribosyltransferase-isomerase
MNNMRQLAAATMHPGEISIDQFLYELPEERIAQFPASERDASRLLVYRQGQVAEKKFAGIVDCLPENATLVFNDSRVLEARLHFTKPSGGKVEIFLLEPESAPAGADSALQARGSGVWKCLIGGASKWKKGQGLTLLAETRQNRIVLEARFRSKEPDHFLIEFRWTPENLAFAEVLSFCGSVPLPPYLKRKPGPSDPERYQTIYAKREGSVAAPTAGLHFTGRIFTQLEEKKIRKEFLTLHVGAGTFRPVTSRTLGDHQMHEEWMEVTRRSIESLREQAGRFMVPVGTTSLRTLESIYWLGVRTIRAPETEASQLRVSQWEGFPGEGKGPSLTEALDALRDWMLRRGIESLVCSTRLLIAPGYLFHLADALITNFHQPGSTLLLLVAAFIGPDWKKMYAYALAHEFRFLSYGDCCLLFRD